MLSTNDPNAPVRIRDLDHSNRRARFSVAGLPLAWAAGAAGTSSLAVGSQRFEGAGAVPQMIYPSPFGAERYVVLPPRRPDPEPLARVWVSTYLGTLYMVRPYKAPPAGRTKGQGRAQVLLNSGTTFREGHDSTVRQARRGHLRGLSALRSGCPFSYGRGDRRGGATARSVRRRSIEVAKGP